MRPPAIIRAAVERGLSVIAVCDHNSAGNTAAVAEAAMRRARRPDGDRRHGGHLPGGGAHPGSVPGLRRRHRGRGRSGGRSAALAAASAGGRRASGPGSGAGGCDRSNGGLRAADAGRGQSLLLERRGGPDPPPRRAGGGGAHGPPKLQRPGQLGFLPLDVPFDALEISAAGARRGRAADFEAPGLPLVSSSDGHFLEDIGAGLTVLEVEGPCFPEIARALRRIEGRSCRIA